MVKKAYHTICLKHILNKSNLCRILSYHYWFLKVRAQYNISGKVFKNGPSKTWSILEYQKSPAFSMFSEGHKMRSVTWNQLKRQNPEFHFYSNNEYSGPFNLQFKIVCKIHNHRYSHLPLILLFFIITSIYFCKYDLKISLFK